jgi:hypothetical protein
MQAWCSGQSVAVKHFVTHIPPPEQLWLPLHIEHAPPPVPHAVEPVPGWQLVPSQQPPLHGSPPEQSVPQVLPLQAWFIPQSAAAMQPHVPPVAPGMHALSVEAVVQSAHMPPLSPQAPLVDPAWHITPSQHPPLQGEPGSAQLFVHIPPMQAWSVGQSLAFVHPVAFVQLPEGAQFGCPNEHRMHLPPPAPHAMGSEPGWHSVPSQHPPLHDSPPEQLEVHVCVPGSQASFIGQSLARVQPLPVSVAMSLPTSLATSLVTSRDTTSPGAPSFRLPPSFAEPPSSPAVSSPSVGARREHAETSAMTKGSAMRHARPHWPRIITA